MKRIGFAATTTAEVADQIPADVYSVGVLNALYANRELANVISGFREDLTAAAGDTVQVPYLAPRTAQGPIAEGTALSDVATTSGTYPIALAKYGDYDLVNREVWEDQDNFSEGDFVMNIGEALAEKVDQVLYAAAEGAAAGTLTNLATAGDLTDLYEKVVDCKAAMKKLKVKPSHLIIGPDQEARFLKDAEEGIRFTQIQVRDGELLQVAGLSVIVTANANANVLTAGEVQAIIIDSRRALGEAWGRRPDTTVDEVSKAESDQVKLVTWIRYGAAALDLDAIGHVRNAP